MARITEVEHCWIEMPDGVRLAARIWRPEGAPCPALLEYIPYRKRDLVRARDARNHPYFAAHGYACLRVDMRGSGDSEGHMPDMYAPDELADARHVINWIANQPWCNGKVGMFGTSWGGTASLQAAVDAPEPLKAVLANCATIDRFEDDIHWMGGCLLTDSFEWGATLPAILAAPPDAATVGPDWQAQWQARLERLTSPLENWIKENRRGAYWRHGSVRFSADRLSCPVLAIGGWADRYSNSVMRLVAARPDLCRGIVGPWGHHYPDQGNPSPGAHFQDLALAWWDHWLRDGPAPEGPSLRLWERAFETPADRIDTRAGHWVAASYQPDAETVFHATPTGLSQTPAPHETGWKVPADVLHGAAAGDTGYFGRPGGLPLDQAPDDARALTLESAPLQDDIALIGHAQLHLEVTQPEIPGQIVARLCDVDAQGRANLITRTVLNLSLDGPLDNRDKTPIGGPRQIALRFPSMAYRLAKGHRLRLALGRSYWPLVWPDQEACDAPLCVSAMRLSLPCPTEVTPCEGLPQPQVLPVCPTWRTQSDGGLSRTSDNRTNGRHDGWHAPRTTVTFTDTDLAYSAETTMQYEVQPDRKTCRCSVHVSYDIDRPDGLARIDSWLDAVSDPDGLRVDARLRAVWQSTQVFERAWTYGAQSSGKAGPVPKA